MPSAVPDIDNPWIVGVVTGVIVILAQWSINWTIERQRWFRARLEFPTRSLRFAEHMTKALRESMLQSSGMLFLDDDLKKSLQNIQDESMNFSIFMNIYSKIIPSHWAADLSTIADQIMLASRSARLATLSCPDLTKREGRSRTNNDLGNYVVTEIGIINGDRYAFTGTGDELDWKKFGQEVYSCCKYLSTAVDDLLRFHNAHAEHLRSPKSHFEERRDANILVGKVSENGRHIKTCAQLMEQWKLNRLKLETGAALASSA